MSQLERYVIGPAWILTASSITDPLDQWTNLGYTRGNVTVGVVPGKLIKNFVDQIGSMPLASATYKFGDTFEIGFPMLDKQIDKLLKVAPGSVKLTNNSKDAFALPSGVGKESSRAFAVVPTDQYTEGDAWWDAPDAIWMFAGIANVNDQITNYKRREEDDLAPFDVSVTHVDNLNGRGGIGPVWLPIGGTNVLGFNVAAEMSKRVTDTDTENALNTAGFNTLRDLVDNTGSIDLSTNSLTDLSGLEYAFNSSGLNVSDNNVSQANMSDFIDALWKVRASLGDANCVIDISLNNGVDADATAKIDGTGDYLYGIQALDKTNKTFTVAGDQRGKFPGGRKFTVEGNSGTTESHAIVAVDTTNEIVEIGGDQTSKLSVNDTIEISGSTGNDGTYTVSAVTYNSTSGNTEITVAEDLTDSTADGDVIITTADNNGTYTVASGLRVEYDPSADQTRIPVNETIPSATADGSVNDGLVGAGCTVTT